ncbi:MAG: hypothetical protein AAGA58_11870 [Verrucomicrobiota bacterium]
MSTSLKDSGETMDAGLQPIDGLLNQLGIDNHAVVDASNEQLTHKVVAKARKGRKLTRRAQEKVLRAVCSAAKAAGEKAEYVMTDLFTYEGR